MIAEQLKKSILQAAIQGKLTQQLPEDGDARDLLKDIQKEKARLIKEGKIKKEKPLPEITEDEIPFEIPENWCWVRLGEIANYKKGPFGSALTKSMFIPDSEQSIKVYEQKNAIQKDPNLGDYFISYDYYHKSMEGFTVSGEDVIISCAGTIGEAFILPKNVRKGIINQALMRVKVFNDLNKLFFLELFHYAINTKDARGKGSAIKNIPPFDVLKNIIVPIPPKQEQNRIIERIKELLLEIESLKNDEARLEELQKSFPKKMKDAILQYAIQGKLTQQLPEDGDARDLLKDIQKEKAQLIKEGKIKKEKPLPEITEDEIPFEIPENWCWVRLGEIGRIINGFTPLRSNSEFWQNKDIPWFTVSDIRNQGHIITSTQEYISNASINGNNRIVPSNSVLLCCTASIGEYAFTKINLTTNQQFNGISVRGEYSIFIDPKYIYYYVQTLTGKLLIEAGKTTFPFLSTSKLANFLIPVGPFAEQLRVINSIEELLPEIDKLNKVCS